VGNNGVNYFDPLGLTPKKEFSRGNRGNKDFQDYMHKWKQDQNRGGQDEDFGYGDEQEQKAEWESKGCPKKTDRNAGKSKHRGKGKGGWPPDFPSGPEPDMPSAPADATNVPDNSESSASPSPTPPSIPSTSVPAMPDVPYMPPVRLPPIRIPMPEPIFVFP